MFHAYSFTHELLFMLSIYWLFYWTPILDNIVCENNEYSKVQKKMLRSEERDVTFRWKHTITAFITLIKHCRIKQLPRLGIHFSKVKGKDSMSSSEGAPRSGVWMWWLDVVSEGRRNSVIRGKSSCCKKAGVSNNRKCKKINEISFEFDCPFLASCWTVLIEEVSNGRVWSKGMRSQSLILMPPVRHLNKASGT